MVTCLFKALKTSPSSVDTLFTDRNQTIFVMKLSMLLDHWAELEPGHCTHKNGMVMIRGWLVCYDFDCDDRLHQMELQGSIQASIEARGWHWRLFNKGTLQSPRYEAAVIVRIAPNIRPQVYSFDGPAPSAAHALLTAYIDALKKMASSAQGVAA